ncbi:MAG: Bax inhibitor-1/YccA family protein [Candidatus Izimaplasma sp.]|nr:Bax inhibitor-1/YccA family protein [Candidatus Izimaplasma bacterium]
MRFNRQNIIYKTANFEHSSVDTASYSGVITKSFYLLALIVASAIGMMNFSIVNQTMYIPLLFIAPIIGIIMVFVTHSNPRIAPITTTIYAIAEGVFLGVFSLFAAVQFGSQILRVAILSTFGVVSIMLLLYKTGIIRVGPFFRRFLMTALFGLIGASLLLFVLSIFGGLGGAFYAFYVVIVVVSVIIASLFLLMDFDNITKAVEHSVDKRFEWTLALGLVVTIVWLYIEILRLLMILNSNR